MSEKNILLTYVDWVGCTPEDVEQINRILRWQEGKDARKVGEKNDG